MSVMIKNLDMPMGCQKCKFFRKHMFGNGLDYSYSCILGAKEFPMPWIRQMDERASDCPIKSSEQNHILDKIRAEFINRYPKNYAGEPELGGASCVFSLNKVLEIIDKYKAESEVPDAK